MSALISVNVGLPRDAEWHGKTVRTAIWKRPVEGRVMARRLNLAGDGQGDLLGHGGEHRAVMVYQRESYHYWENYLHRSGFVYGQFGENLTVDGLADTEVCIGDRFRIGGAILLPGGHPDEPRGNARFARIPSAAGILSPSHRRGRDRRGGRDL